MTLRESAVITAKWWGILPHVIWRYPFRYFKELRDAHLATLRTPARQPDDGEAEFASAEGRERVIEFDREMFRGDAL